MLTLALTNEEQPAVGFPATLPLLKNKKKHSFASLLTPVKRRRLRGTASSISALTQFVENLTQVWSLRREKATVPSLLRPISGRARFTEPINWRLG